MNKSSLIKEGVTIIFLGCLLLGSQLALRKTLWNDEIHTQLRTVEEKSWSQISKGQVLEGNNAPLYYLIQKSIESLAHFHLPFHWIGKQDGRIYHPYSQVLLRASANLCMSLSISFIVWYFWTYFSLGAALLALVSCLSSFMLLAYWAEARPYALWFLLTTLQMLVFLKAFKTKKPIQGWE